MAITLCTYKPLERDGWEQSGASRSCTYLCPFLWELIENGLHYWVTSLAVFVVSHSSLFQQRTNKGCLSSHLFFYYYFPVNSFNSRSAGGSFLREHTKVRGQSNMEEEVAFQGQIIL